MGNRPNLLVRTINGENTSNGIVGDICLHNDQSIQNPICECMSGGEGIFDVLEGRVTGVTEVLRNTFTGEARQRSDDTTVVIYKSPIKVHKPKEGLHVLDLLRLGPVLYGLYPLQGYSKSRG